MQVQKSKLVAVLSALSVHGSDTWPLGKLTARVNQDGGLARYTENGTIRPQHPDVAALMDEIIASQTTEPVEVVADPVSESGTFPLVPPTNGKPKGKKVTPKKVKPAKKSQGRPAYQGFKDFPSWVAHLKKNPMPLPTEGILAVCIDELKSAGKGVTPKPITKDHLLSVIKKQYPDRDVKGLLTNLNNNVPGRLRWKHGVHVWRVKLADGKKGYFIKGDGKQPQPKEIKQSVPSGKPKTKTAIRKPKVVTKKKVARTK